MIVSCVVCQKPKRAVIIGTYEFNPVYGVWNSLELKGDSSFLFQWRTGLIAGETFGDWEIIGNKLILNSERQEKINPAHYKLIRANKTLSDSVTIEVLTSEDSLPSFFLWFV